VAIHLSMNYAAVRAVSMNTLNRQRANIVFSSLLANDKVLTPKEVSIKERVFETDGVLRWSINDNILGYVQVGVGTVALADQWSYCKQDFATAIDSFRDELYLLAVDTSRKPVHVLIGVKRGCSSRQQLKSWLHALIIASELSSVEPKPSSHQELRRRNPSDALTRTITDTLMRTSGIYADYCLRLEAAGWDLDTAALETRFGPRIGVGLEDKKSK